MENASKALLMAASVLIGILIISLAVYLFVTFGSASAKMHKQNEVQQIAQFNSQFTSYEEKECTIYDVITLANLATENNIYYELTKTEAKENTNYISVLLERNSMEGAYGEKSKTEEYNQYIFQEVQNKDLTKYKCKVTISEITQRVYKVVFTSI